MFSTRVDEFAQYVIENRLKGRQGDNPDANFISRSALRRFWTHNRVNAILLDCQPPIYQNAKQIQSEFICVFSILVFLGHPEAISQLIEKGLDDHSLPLTTRPDVWPEHHPYIELFPEFFNRQWDFIPLDFQNGVIHKRTIHPKMILPVEFEEKLGRNSGGDDVAVVWKVKIHDECKGYIKMGTVVFKIYQRSAKDAFISEANAYATFPETYGENIVQCHGTFKQEEKYIIILEYAPRGSLLDFFETTRRLPTTDELRILWTELFKLLGALYMIHENGLPSSSAPIGISGYAETHHDIQPANILVFPRDSDFEYSVYFKLADFGTTRIIKMISGGPDTQVGSNEGNRMYTAPESCPVYPFQDEVPKRVNPTVDVWALGAVFSETFIWSILGEPGRETYRKLRNEENQESKGMRGSGYEACFHNGTNSLKAVIKMHDYAVLETRRIDTVSPEISNVILKYMLQPLRDRLDAKSALSKADEALEQARQETQQMESSGLSRNPGEPNPMKQDISTFLSSPNSLASSTTMHGRSPGSLNQLPHGRFSHETRSGVMMVPEIKPVTCREVYRMLERRNRQFFAMGSTSEALKVRGISEALSQISEVDGREQLILIDDFTSMRAHKDNVEETARVISYYVKRADPNNMELYFASNISVKYQCKNSSHVESIIRKHEFVDGKCAMGSCLASILNHVWVSLESSKSPVSIYVLTDGVWEAEDDEIGFAIAKSAQKLEESNIFPPRIMIQFIRFGQDPNGIRRLKVLDDDLVELYNLRKYDIVDTKDCHAHVSDILLGSISRLSDATERGPTPAT
ncbi:kinase-like domain-containing protein [Dactylonectria macrodidyma]|uniref:Kinase-like domain-containing protein n=1 Tax=Dactylonectria macrodidyma TaxID=307937 RepID=A0A9P9FS52_9HYPO|nr:kinase-like domain-containing protein [Dactylonectria macrodidyma]